MKRLYTKVFKSKKPSHDSIHGPGPSSTNLMSSIPASDATASAQLEVTAGVRVSFQLRSLASHS